MSKKLNYRGVLVTSGQYKRWANTFQNKSYIHYSPPKERGEREDYLDKIWFRLGYSDSMNIFVAQQNDEVVAKLVYSGLLYDLRDIELPQTAKGVYDLIHEILYGKSTRIRLCNEIRDALASCEQIRWCGAESESVFNDKIYQNASEICGNTPPGQFLRVSGGIEGDIPDTRNESHLRILYSQITRANDDEGQRKLGCIMCAIPRCGFAIIYVGGAPGNAWLQVAKLREMSCPIIVIDPGAVTEHTEGLTILHIREMVQSLNDLTRFLAIEGVDECIAGKQLILIWDVRAANISSYSEERREEAIRYEIATLNEIVSSDWFHEKVAMYQLKINATNIGLYELPEDSKIFLQPHTLSRQVYELRCIGFGQERKSSMRVLEAAQIEGLNALQNEIRAKLEKGEVKDYDLFLNFITSMFRECDYIENGPLTSDNNREVAIYTLNWNSETKLCRYLQRLKDNDTKFVGSFFTQDMLGEGEYVFNESLLLTRFPSMVFDSRALVPAKVEGLYFFTNCVDCAYMNNELLFSECYLIGATEYRLHSENRMEDYDLIRTEVSDELGCKFPKFPNSFAVRSELISPSGHSLRMFLEYVSSRASLVMFVYKILSNFYMQGRMKIFECWRTRIFHDTVNSSWLPELGTRFQINNDRLEKAGQTLWHSQKEWISGYMSAQRLCRRERAALEEFSSYLRATINCNLHGSEIYIFLKKGWLLDKSPDIRLARVQLRTDINDPYLLQVIKSYEMLFRLKNEDWISWLLTPKGNSTKREWRVAVYTLGLDASARDYVVHKAYINTISNKFQAHDYSKTGLLELIKIIIIIIIII